MLQSGVNIYWISQQMGHSNAQMTLVRYSKYIRQNRLDLEKNKVDEFVTRHSNSLLSDNRKNSTKTPEITITLRSNKVKLDLSKKLASIADQIEKFDAKYGDDWILEQAAN